jgi:DNA topoisomerase III
MELILAEKNSQAKDYLALFPNHKKNNGYYEIEPCSYFPSGAYLTWGVGHLVTLQEPVDYNESWGEWSLDHLPMIPSTFKFKVPSDKQKQFNIIKKLLKNVSSVNIATDTDREGENIARSILHFAGYSHLPTKRLWFNSTEVTELQRAFNDLKDGKQFIPLYHEAQARQIADWLVGLNASRLYTKLIQKQGLRDVFSVGRVQTPTLKLIYDRQKEIDEFQSKPFFEIHGEFQINQERFKAKSEIRFQELAEATEHLSKHNLTNKSESDYTVQEVSKKKKETPSPKLFTLSHLQTHLNKKYKYPTKKSLKMIQKLYDSPLKLLTYPRTSSEYITEHEFEYLKANVTAYQQIINNPFPIKNQSPNKRYVDSSKVQEHYAIIPTKKIPTQQELDSLTKEEKTVYFEVIKRMLGMFHEANQYEETEAVLNMNNFIFRVKGKTVLNQGWKSLVAEEQEKEETPLPVLTEGFRGRGKPIIHEGKTKPPKRYTEGQLLPMMATCGKYIEDDELREAIKVEGLGTEATRTNIIDTLVGQKYIEIKNNQVFVTEKGKLLIEVVDDTLLAKPELTARWETYLNKIGKREGDKDTFIENIKKFVTKLVNDVQNEFKSELVTVTKQELEQKEHITSCPSCKKGSIVSKKTFYGCTEYKNGCTYSLPKKKLNKNLSPSQIKSLIEKGKTNKIKGFQGKNKPFDTHLVLVDGKINFPFEKSGASNKKEG